MMDDTNATTPKLGNKNLNHKHINRKKKQTIDRIQISTVVADRKRHHSEL